jgi:hypothetical protein
MGISAAMWGAAVQSIADVENNGVFLKKVENQVIENVQETGKNR